MERFVLTNAEVNTECWRKLKAHYVEVLAHMRSRLEQPRMDERERTALCWQIQIVKEFLAIEDQAQKNVIGAGQ